MSLLPEWLYLVGTSRYPRLLHPEEMLISSRESRPAEITHHGRRPEVLQDIHQSRRCSPSWRVTSLNQVSSRPEAANQHGAPARAGPQTANIGDREVLDDHDVALVRP